MVSLLELFHAFRKLTSPCGRCRFDQHPWRGSGTYDRFGEADPPGMVGFTGEEIFLASMVDPALFHRHDVTMKLRGYFKTAPRGIPASRCLSCLPTSFPRLAPSEAGVNHEHDGVQPQVLQQPT